MNSWKKTILPVSASVRDAATTIDSTPYLVAIVVDPDGKTVGMITDGDIRRGILKGATLSDSVQKIMNPHPKTVNVHDSPNKIRSMFQLHSLRHLPVVDDLGHVIGLQFVENFTLRSGYDNWVVLMAGGLGTRLGELTENCPKPLLKIGNKPLLETILENFIENGFHHFYISVNYRADMIENYFGDGSKWGIEIRYIRERQRLGTAGALSLLPEKPISPLIVMNGDVLTKVNFQMLLEFHKEQEAFCTMCVREYDFQVPYGVVNISNHKITAIDEKPIHRFFVNAGIYVLSPDALDLIPGSTFFDMPKLFETILERGDATTAFPIREYWLDIGQVDDFKKANGDYKEIFPNDLKALEKPQNAD